MWMLWILRLRSCQLSKRELWVTGHGAFDVCYAILRKKSGEKLDAYRETGTMNEKPIQIREEKSRVNRARFFESSNLEIRMTVIDTSSVSALRHAPQAHDLSCVYSVIW